MKSCPTLLFLASTVRTLQENRSPCLYHHCGLSGHRDFSRHVRYGYPAEVDRAIREDGNFHRHHDLDEAAGQMILRPDV